MLPKAGHSSALGPCFLICKMKGVDWMTVKAPSSSERIPGSLPLSLVSLRKRKALGLEEWHEMTGLILCHHCPLTAGLVNICLICQVNVTLCGNTLKEDEKVSARKRRYLTQEFILFGTFYCLD